MAAQPWLPLVGRRRLSLSKLRSKAPGTKRLNLNLDLTISIFACNINLRRHTVELSGDIVIIEAFYLDIPGG